ncbi:MAG TPA: heme-dependent oxidative N-demethylase subunit alpha family protein [Ideonella sp.]|uniref:heme-dependent oxidative N-demethylase subunit alpha family protein n=1 Tax=Ideonella sp. TaxID=1929293 RepID=UPI002CB8A736|nr:heme-dependent oxidative N-demethylase subunit alpha family protein [Ideonella sp.]HSI46893.1 heme-dependent oxidative N-demethylase subunit alpha family protein [Ideonella sp.]
MAFDFDHAVTAPFRMQPGLRRLAPGAAQFTPNRPGARHLQAKLTVLTRAPLQALMRVPDFDAGPALAAVVAQLSAEHPQAFAALPDGGLGASWLGVSVDTRGELLQTQNAMASGVWQCLQALPHEWRLAGLLALALEEDLAIVDGNRATLPWLAVALPSHWAPADKLGKHFAEVHAPVADNKVLVAAGEHLLRLACGPERWERFVWNITPHALLDQHPARLAAAQAAGETPAGWPELADADELAAMAWFRTERQTFLPLPELQQAVFTIHVQTQPLCEAVDEPPKAALLRAAIASMSPAVLAYRGLASAQVRLLAFWDRHAPAP